MSEYRYYEFQAIDRPLTERQMRQLRAISSRAVISRTRFSNYYTFGNLKANPRDPLASYFDASLSFAHWHFVELAFRYPKSAVDVKSLRPYRSGQSLEVCSKGPNIIIAMSVEREDFDAADDGQGWLSFLIALRMDIASGDERALYLAWLLGVQQGEIEDGAIEPALPDGIATPSPALESFIDIMGVDRDLVVAAAEGSRQASSGPSEGAIDQWIAALDEHQKVALLGRVARGEPGVGAELMRRFRQEGMRRKPETRRRRTAAHCVRVRRNLQNSGKRVFSHAKPRSARGANVSRPRLVIVI